MCSNRFALSTVRFALLVLMMITGAATALDAQVTGRGGTSPPPDKELGFLMRNQDTLHLTDEQIQQMRAVAERLQRQNEPLIRRLRSAGIPVRPDERRMLRQLTPEQRRGVREAMEANRPVFRELRENTRAAMLEVRQLLTPAQTRQVRRLMQEREGRPGARGRLERRRPPHPRKPPAR